MFKPFGQELKPKPDFIKELKTKDKLAPLVHRGHKKEVAYFLIAI